MKSPAHREWHHLHAEEVLRLLEVDLVSGLSEDEVRRRQVKFGLNRLTPQPGPSAWRRFQSQFQQPLVYLLGVAAAVTALLGEWMDAGVILGVVLVNAVIGYVQETKAADAIAALSRLLVVETTVRRGGRQLRLPSDQLVPGDIAVLRAGDRVGADLRLVHLQDLQIDESTLTGESVPVRKHLGALAAGTLLADRKNLAFAGTLVTAGTAEGVVWATGDLTETGRIARLLTETVEPVTPLQARIARFSRFVLWTVLALAAGMFGLGLGRGGSAADMFMTAVALAVAAIPEGLPAAVTSVLAIGLARMARRRAIIRQLTAVETLGSTTVICTDKTGTLTQNTMTVREIFAGGQHYKVASTGHDADGRITCDDAAVDTRGDPALAECLHAGLLCNDAQLTRGPGRPRAEGDPTEIALIVAGEKGGLAQGEATHSSPRLDAIPFGSAHMFRATLHEARVGRVIYQVGAAERVLELCTDTLDRQGNRRPLDIAAMHAVIAAMAARGLRVLALARRAVARDHARLEPSHVAGGLTLLGFQGMIDPPRAEAAAAVQLCRRAGIAVKMITGDHLITARAIASQIGLQGVDPPEQIRTLTGRELDRISPAELPAVAERVTVFARVTPEQKLRLVGALQTLGHVVAMTGDGVNDAPALKRSDIGVAMGVAGTEVAKGAADMVLADDNFASIAAAVEEGRAVHDNLVKFITWIAPTNLAEALLLISALVMGLPLPALPLQLLWINLTDTLLGLPLAFEPKQADVMTRPPLNPQTPLLTRALRQRLTWLTPVLVTGALWLFAWELTREAGSLAVARTSVVNALVLVQVLYLFNCRSPGLPWWRGFFANPWAFVGAGLMSAAQLLFTYSPLMHRFFHTAALDGGSWRRIAGFSFAIFLLVELEKWLARRLSRPSAGQT